MADVYVYAALLLHKAGKPITVDSVNSVLIGGAGLESTDDARVKQLVAALEGVDIDAVLAMTQVKGALPDMLSTLPPPDAPSEADSGHGKDKDNDVGLGQLFGDK